MLEVKDLHKYYGSFHAVRGISFDVSRGEIVGFLGPNGAGKTTTMKIVVGFMTMSSGTVTVDGRDVVKESMDVRRTIGYLPEHAPLYEDMTVDEYLAFIADVRGLRGQARKDRLEYAVGVCALGPKRKSGIKTLSKGYRQRVGLAQAIVHDPKLVILDEPTVGLDPNQIIEIRNLIQEIGEKNTVVLSSHILGEVEATCSRVVIINEGLIVANGTSEQLERDLGDKPMLEVELGATAADAAQALGGLDTVARVVQSHDVDDGSRILLELGDAGDALEAVSALARQNSWTLREAVRPRKSLEDVFKALTGGRAQADEPVATAAVQDGGDES